MPHRRRSHRQGPLPQRARVPRMVQRLTSRRMLFFSVTRSKQGAARMRALHSLGIVVVVLLSFGIANAQTKPKPQPAPQQASTQPQTISPEELVAILKAPKGDKPLIL